MITPEAESAPLARLGAGRQLCRALAGLAGALSASLCLAQASMSQLGESTDNPIAAELTKQGWKQGDKVALVVASSDLVQIAASDFSRSADEFYEEFKAAARQSGWPDGAFHSASSSGSARHDAKFPGFLGLMPVHRFNMGPVLEMTGKGLVAFTAVGPMTIEGLGATDYLNENALGPTQVWVMKAEDAPKELIIRPIFGWPQVALAISFLLAPLVGGISAWRLLAKQKLTRLSSQIVMFLAPILVSGGLLVALSPVGSARVFSAWFGGEVPGRQILSVPLFGFLVLCSAILLADYRKKRALKRPT